jgi:hypothetical protein
MAHVGTLRLSGKRPVVEFVPEGRSLDQNSMIYALYQQIAAQQPESSIVDIRREAKLHYGVPILMAHSEEFRYVYDKAIKPLEYEFKLRAMDWLPVTSKMSKAQGSEFIDTVIREYSQQGLCLVHPSEVYA